MGNYLKQIYKISSANYQTLKDTGSLTYNGKTYKYDPNNLYLIENNLTDDYVLTGGGGSKLISELSVKHADSADKATSAETASEATHATKADSATSATKADTASKVTNKLTVGSKTYDGSTAVSLTKADLGLGNVDNTADKNKVVDETKIRFGTTNLNSNFSPLDVAIFNEFNSNRLGFFDPSHISVEYSTDGGETWIDYGASDSNKSNLVTQHLPQTKFTCGKATKASERNVLNRLKISFFDFKTCSISLYCSFRKFAILISSCGSTSMWCTLRKNTKANPDVFTDVVTKATISGWSFWNILNFTPFTVYGNTDTQSTRIEFIFGYDDFYDVTDPESTTFCGLSIDKIYGISDTLYSGSVYQKLGVVYETSYDKSIKFPSNLSAEKQLSEGGKFLEQKYVQQVSGKQLSTNDYTTAEKNKLAGLSNAEALTNSEIDEAIK